MFQVYDSRLHLRRRIYISAPFRMFSNGKGRKRKQKVEKDKVLIDSYSFIIFSLNLFQHRSVLPTQAWVDEAISDLQLRYITSSINGNDGRLVYLIRRSLFSPFRDHTSRFPYYGPQHLSCCSNSGSASEFLSILASSEISTYAAMQDQVSSSELGGYFTGRLR